MTAFLRRAKRGRGFPLPIDATSKLMDLGCLLSLIEHNPSRKRPKLHQDVVSLLQDTLANWKTF